MLRRERGFILPFAVLLVMILTISGTSFLQHDYLERRMAMDTVDNHAAFYLANAGIERAREVFAAPDWTLLLSDPAQTDGAPDPRLCPDTTQGCLVPPFGPSVGSATPLDQRIPFDQLFTRGRYAVRVFNNVEPSSSCPGPSTNDCDQTVIVRALGTVAQEQKLLEATVQNNSKLRLINCLGDTDDPCPPSPQPAQIVPSPGREPASFPQLPAFDGTFYSNAANFPLVTHVVTLSGRQVSFTPTSPLQPDTYYRINGDVSLEDVVADNVVIFSTGQVKITVSSGTLLQLTNTTIIGLAGVNIHRSPGADPRSVISARRPYPALIGGSGGVQDYRLKIVGAVYSEGYTEFNSPTPHTPADPGAQLHGPLIVNANARIDLKTSNVKVTDDGDPGSYATLPGFTYPVGFRQLRIIPGSWMEVE